MRTVTATARSSAPPDVVFGVVSDNRRWKDWTFVRRSTLDAEGDPAPDGVGALRRLGPPGFASRERVVEYEPSRRFAYELVSGLPVRSYRADAELTPDGDGTTITWRGRFEPFPGTGSVMGALLRRMLQGFATGAARRAEELVAEAG